MATKTEKFIAITHFINPQLFWYHDTYVPNENFHKISVLEEELATFYKNVPNTGSRDFRPAIDKRVAVNFVAWNKFIRAQVLNIVHLGHTNEYIVWALDYGFPFQTKLQHMRRLPETKCMDIDHVRCGGLVDVYAAEKDFDFMKGCGVMGTTDKWCQRACDMLEKLLNDAASITFVEHYSRGEHFWGDLKIVNHTGNVFLAQEYLVGINCAIGAGPSFADNCLTLKTTRILPWLSNSGNNKFKINSYYSANMSGNQDTLRGNYCDKMAKEKIDDWCARNELAGGYDCSVKTVETVDSNSDTIAVDDITCDDSVSATQQKPHMLRSLRQSDSDVRCLEMTGAIGKPRHQGKLPPPPDKHAFQIDTGAPTNPVAFMTNTRRLAAPTESATYINDGNSTTMSPSVSGISLRQQQLLELRKKHARDSYSKCSTAATSHHSNQQPVESISSTSDVNTSNDIQLENEMSKMHLVTEPVVTIPTSSAASNVSRNSSLRMQQLLNLRRKHAKLEESKTKPIEHVEKSNSEVTTTSSINSLTTESTSAQIPSSYLAKLKQQRLATKSTEEKVEEKTEEQSALNAILYKKVPIEISAPETVNYPNFSEISQGKAEKQNENLDLLSRTVIPAGFDMTNLCRYKDEKNHWHRKKTTRHDQVPHDNTTTSSEMENANKSDNTNILSQNFRHTRPHSDKFKNPISDQVDTAEPYNKSSTDDNMNLVADNVQNATGNSSKSSTLISRKRRQLKSPTLQMNKIDSILTKALQEQKAGNANISISSSGDTDSNTSPEGGKGCGNELMKTSNKSALTANRLQSKISPQSLTQPIKKISPLSLKSEHKLEQLLSTDKHTIKFPHAEQLHEIDGEHKLQTKFIDHLVLAHSKVPLHPLEKLAEAYFPQEIHDEMVHMRISKIYRNQAYAWPHLMRGNSLVVISPAKTGKTWCFLPPICSMISYRIQTCEDTFGPMAIILVASSTHVERVFSSCRRMLTQTKCSAVPVVPSFGIRNLNETKIKLFNSCGILVATPANFLRLLQDPESDRLIDPNRLQHFIVDDIDTIMARSQQDFEVVLKIIFKMFKRPAQTLSLQLVVTSREWDATMIPLLNYSNQPLLLIGDFLEAAVYGKAAISIKFCSTDEKMSIILKYIEKHPVERERMLVMCKCDEDVYELVNSFTKAGQNCIGYYSDSSAELRRTVSEWTKQSCATQILICTDLEFPELQIQNVQNLVHYSMPTSWTKFTMRFSALARTYVNYVSQNFASQADTSNQTHERVAHSLILLDEENNIQLPRLVDFMKKHNQKVHADIVAVSKRVLITREEERICKGIPMCPYIMEFGECDDSRCDNRHNLTPFDAISKSDDIPTAGELRILILKVFSPTYYSARLLEHKPPEATKWHKVRNSDKTAFFGMQLHYANLDHLIRHWPLENNDICVYKVADRFERVRVLDVPELKNTNVIVNFNVTIKLIDVGTTITSVQADDLYICDEKFKQLPAQAIDIRLTGVKPFDNDRTWDTKATKSVQTWLMEDIKRGQCVYAKINFALANSIWVSEVIVMESLPTVGKYIHQINLKRSLIHKNFAMLDIAERQHIREIAEEFGLLREDNEMGYESCCNDDSSKFASAENELSLMDNSISETKENLIHTAAAAAGSGTAAAEEEDWDDSFEFIKATEVSVPIDARTHFDSATEASAKQHESWYDLSLRKPMKVEIGDENENGNWSDIFLQCIDNVNIQKFDQLLVIINKHIENLKQQQSVQRFADAWFQPMRSCIIKYNEIYLRAKIHGIFGGDASDRVYRFFLCDYACFVTATASDLYKDFLYDTSEEIVAYMPYQAVHCTLAGIDLDRFAKRYQVTKSYLYAYAVKKHDCIPYAPKNFDICSYDILLYECEEEGDFSRAQQLNKALLRHGVATPDIEKKHLLDLDVFGKDSEEGLTNFEELLNCIQRAFEMDAAEIELNDDEDELRLRKTLRETKAICAATIEKQREPRNVAGKIKKCAAESSKEVTLKCDKSEEEISKPKKKVAAIEKRTLESEEELLSSSTSEQEYVDTSSSLATTTTQEDTAMLPALTLLNKRPQTTWYETDCLIYIQIYAPDIKEYFLEVTGDTLTYAAFVCGERQALFLNFLGTIDPKLVSHEIRGLSVVVRLVKSIFVKWPRLLKQTTKFPWLTYNLNAIDTTEIEHLLPQQRMLLALEQHQQIEQQLINRHYQSDSDNDSEINLFKTYTPIVNCEDSLDPTAEIF